MTERRSYDASDLGMIFGSEAANHLGAATEAIITLATYKMNPPEHLSAEQAEAELEELFNSVERELDQVRPLTVAVAAAFVLQAAVTPPHLTAEWELREAREGWASFCRSLFGANGKITYDVEVGDETD